MDKFDITDLLVALCIGATLNSGATVVSVLLAVWLDWSAAPSPLADERS